MKRDLTLFDPEPYTTGPTADPKGPPAPTDPASQRLMKRDANRSNWGRSTALRHLDSSHMEQVYEAEQGYDDWPEGEEPKPPTRIGDPGEFSTSAMGMRHEPTIVYGGVPPEVSYHGSSRRTWRQEAQVREVPIVRADLPPGELSGTRTLQADVSSRRMGEILNDRAGTTQTPRIDPRVAREYPRAYNDKRDPDDPILIDGNHRVASAIAEGQMFQPMMVANPSSRPKFKIGAKRIEAARRNALMNPNRNLSNEEDWMERIDDVAARLDGLY